MRGSWPAWRPSPMPRRDRIARAVRLGLCVECTHLPARPNAKWCERCDQTKRGTRKAYTPRRLAGIRLAALHARLLTAHGRAVVAARLAHLPDPPPPTLPTTPPPPPLYYLHRLRRYRPRAARFIRKTHAKPLPSKAPSVLQCANATKTRWEAVESCPAGLLSGQTPLAPQLGDSRLLLASTGGGEHMKMKKPFTMASEKGEEKAEKKMAKAMKGKKGKNC